jgi:ribonuclease P protein component
MRQTFSKDERLRSRKLIESIVSGGRYVQVTPFRLGWIRTELRSKFPIQLAIAVPKRFFKRAVDRNRIKRLIREAYRKNKNSIYTLLQSKGLQIAVLVVFNGRVVPEYKEIENKIVLTLQKLEETIVKNSG